MNRQDGIILVSSLIVLVVVSTLAAGFYTLVNTKLLITSRNLESITAFYIAEAGVADIFQYNDERSFKKEFAGGNYECSMQIGDDGSRLIRSKGIYKDAQRIITLRAVWQEDRYRITNWLEA